MIHLSMDNLDMINIFDEFLSSLKKPTKIFKQFCSSSGDSGRCKRESNEDDGKRLYIYNFTCIIRNSSNTFIMPQQQFDFHLNFHSNFLWTENLHENAKDKHHPRPSPWQNISNNASRNSCWGAGGNSLR